MAAGRLLRALYTRASGTAALRGPLDAIRANPRVRALARRHVGVLLERGRTWANVDGALRLLAEDEGQRIVFGPWDGDVATELLYWAPFVRWAQEHFSLDPERIVVASHGGVDHWYPGTYIEGPAGELPGAALIRPGPVLALVEDYRRGTAAPRPLLKRTRYLPLPPPAHPVTKGLPGAYVAVALAPSPAFPASEANRAAAHDLVQALSPAVSLEETTEGVAPQERLRAQHALLGRATGLVAAWSGLALLGALSGVPTIALRSEDDEVVEPDLDLALRVASELGTSLTILDSGDLRGLAAALGSPAG